jgi:NTP pyrophosphatase (non-canonical NTP hydrolase)
MVALGLCGESGEFADHIKKGLHHGHKIDRDYLTKELGDVLWYVAVAADKLGIALEAVANQNIEKLEKRYPDGFDEEKSRNRVEL